MVIISPNNVTFSPRSRHVQKVSTLEVGTQTTPCLEPSHGRRKLCRQWIEGGAETCRFGDHCRFFHPVLCRNSVHFRVCYNKKCRFAHLKGTRRHRKPQALHTRNRKPFTNITPPLRRQTADLTFQYRRRPAADARVSSEHDRPAPAWRISEIFQDELKRMRTELEGFLVELMCGFKGFVAAELTPIWAQLEKMSKEEVVPPPPTYQEMLQYQLRGSKTSEPRNRR